MVQRSSLFHFFFLHYRKISQRLGEHYKKGIPIEVVPMAYVPIQRRIQSRYGGAVEIRMAVAKAVNILSASLLLNQAIYILIIYMLCRVQ